jgi:hypothetical protein
VVKEVTINTAIVAQVGVLHRLPRSGLAQRNVDCKTRLIHPGLDDTSFLKISCKPLVVWGFVACAVQNIRYKFFMKPGTPPLQSARLLDQVQERVRCLHYSLKTEKSYHDGHRTQCICVHPYAIEKMKRFSGYAWFVFQTLLFL